MFKRAIRTIRRKPKAVRDQYALWTAVVFTAVVITAWYSTIPGRLLVPATESPVIAEDLTEDRSFGEMFDELQEELAEFEATANPTTTVSSTTPAQPTIAAPTADLTTAPEVRIATFTAPQASTTR